MGCGAHAVEAERVALRGGGIYGPDVGEMDEGREEKQKKLNK
jgi:hypothetical protein